MRKQSKLWWCKSFIVLQVSEIPFLECFVEVIPSRRDSISRENIFQAFMAFAQTFQGEKDRIIKNGLISKLYGDAKTL